MAASEVAARLAQLSPRFLEGLVAPELASVVAAATARKFPANYVIARQRYPPNHLFLLLSGRARYFSTTQDGQKILLLWLAPGDICGVAALLSKSTDYLVNTEAVEESYALAWDRKALRRLEVQYPRLIENALLIAYHYLAVYCAAHTSFICQTAQQRLARVLANLASGIGKKVPGGIELNVRNEELANEANVSLFTASRLLNEWQRMGIVEKSRGKVLVHSLKRLPSSSSV